MQKHVMNVSVNFKGAEHEHSNMWNWKCITGKKITNDDLSQIMDTSDEWISSRTGIKTRHLATEETTTSLATEAAKKHLQMQT